MMEKLRSRREKSGMTNKEMSSLDEPGSTVDGGEKITGFPRIHETFSLFWYIAAG